LAVVALEQLIVVALVMVVFLLLVHMPLVTAVMEQI
jgi:hypothetical protein